MSKVTWIFAAVCIAYVLTAVNAWPSFVNESSLEPRVKYEANMMEQNDIPISKRSLVLYHLGELSSEESIDVAENNVKLFTAAVLAHTSATHHSAFYIFRVVGGKKNILARHLPLGVPNAVISKCSHGTRDLIAHIQTVSALGPDLVSRFSSIVFLSHDARGPFEGREDGAWLTRINGLFTKHPLVGLLGATISCEIAPHVQSHAFAMRSKAALQIFEEFNPNTATGRRNRASHMETTLSIVAVEMGYKLSSLAYERHWHEPEYVGRCIASSGNYREHNNNPTSWCNIRPEEALFTKWGGPPLSLRGYFCQENIDNIHAATLKIAETEHSVHLALPETIFGGALYALSKEYDLERWNDQSLKRVKFNSLPRGGETPQKVCLLVRAAAMQGKNAAKGSTTVHMDLDLFITTLLRQSNPNWDAYFFVTDDQPFEDELRMILREHADIRLKYLALHNQFRKKYNPVDAAYPASDEALRIVMQKPECTWLTITNGDNSYGSEVIESILSPTTPKANLILLPMDSRNFATQDGDGLRIRLSNTGYTGYCRYFEKRHKKHMYGFARIAEPKVGGVDVAAVFIERDKFVATNSFFNEFSSAKVPGTCLGCQDGAWVENMVNKRGWTTYIAPFSGLKHMVFHGPSPLWCVASGNVWFDHPEKVACLSHKAVGELYASPLLDWPNFHRPNSSHTCLRLSEEGFRRRSDKVTYLL